MKLARGQADDARYASGLARGFKIPITHVNADDPAACIEAARLAIAYRHQFKLDYVIDLVGYRRYGHNEGDEPAFTQPQIYQIVAAHPTVREKYAASLIEKGETTRDAADAMVQARMAAFEQAYASVKPEQDYVPPVPEVPPSGAAQKVNTAVPLEVLQEINVDLLRLPQGFTVHRKLERGRERRRAMFNSPSAPSIDWAAAEELALATIVADAVPVAASPALRATLVRFRRTDVHFDRFKVRCARAGTHKSLFGQAAIEQQSLFDIRQHPIENGEPDRALIRT